MSYGSIFSPHCFLFLGGADEAEVSCLTFVKVESPWTVKPRDNERSSGEMVFMMMFSWWLLIVCYDESGGELQGQINEGNNY